MNIAGDEFDGANKIVSSKPPVKIRWKETMSITAGEISMGHNIDETIHLVDYMNALEKDKGLDIQ